MRYYLLLGSNIGDRKTNINKCIMKLRGRGLKEFARSALYESLPWGYRPQPRFLNQVVGFETKMSPEQLLRTIKSVEKSIGRQRSWRWGVRKIDVDILLAECRKWRSGRLVIPHPLLPNRIFAILPLKELRPKNFLPPKMFDRGKTWIAT